MNPEGALQTMRNLATVLSQDDEASARIVLQRINDVMGEGGFGVHGHAGDDSAEEYDFGNVHWS